MVKRKKIWKNICRIEERVCDLLYPPRCPICDSVILPKENLCQDCRRDIRVVKEPACMKCGKPISNERKEFCHDCGKTKHRFIQGKSLWIYEGGVRESLYRFKYQNKREYGKRYAREFIKQYGAWLKSKQIQGIIPVPLHKNRQKQRGYNQAEILAKEIGDLADIPVYTNLLIRWRDTKSQKNLSCVERKNNLKKAFKTTKNIVQLKHILVVDDIYTTGNTLDEVAATLERAGVTHIYACCVGIGEES